MQSISDYVDIVVMKGCHQIREFKENQGILCSIRENQGKIKGFSKDHGK